MMKFWLPNVANIVGSLLCVGTVGALRFVALSGSSAFFEPVEQGWNDACTRLGVDCTYVVPDFSNVDNENRFAVDACMEKILELKEGGIDGLALGNPSCIDRTGGQWVNFIKEFEDSGTPVVLYDRDLPNSSRTAYVGTDNVMMGRTMGRLLKQLRPEGGTFFIIGSLPERDIGFIEEVTRDNDREDRAHWFQIQDEAIVSDLPGGPNYIDLMDQYAEKHSPSAIIAMRQSPMRQANWTDHVNRHRHRGITYIGTDGSDYQLSYLHRKYVDGLIGQLPYEFGSESVQALYGVTVEKREVDDIIATNLVAYNLMPLELPIVEVDQNLLGGLRYIGWSSFGLIASSVLACLVWTFANRRGVVVRASQPFFLAMTAGGILIMGCSLIPLSYDDAGDPASMNKFKRIGVCMSIPWLAFTGFTITFSALFSKTWRINTLLSRSSHFLRERVEPRDVLGPFGILMTCNWIVLICWTILDPLTYEREYLPGTDFWNREFASAGSCRSGNSLPYLIPLGLLDVIVIAIACFQAIRARGIEAEFSEATYIGLSMFTLCQACLSGIPIVVVVRNIPKAFYLVLTFLLLLLCTVILFLIFLPMMVLQKKYTGMTRKDQQAMLTLKLRNSIPGSSRRSPADSSLQNGDWSSQLNITTPRARFGDAVDNGKEDLVSAELKIKISKTSSEPNGNTLVKSPSALERSVESDSSDSETISA